MGSFVGRCLGGYRFFRGITFVRQHKYKQAQKALSSVDSRGRFRAQVLLLQADIEAYLGNYDNAIKGYEKCSHYLKDLRGEFRLDDFRYLNAYLNYRKMEIDAYLNKKILKHKLKIIEEIERIKASMKIKSRFPMSF